MTSAIATVLWPGIRDIVGSDAVNAGILVDKPGYHNSRNRLIARGMRDDYSIVEWFDKLGPGDEGAALDVTFKSAQAGDYRNIAKYSKRLFDAGLRDDPRAYPLREFFGNIDLDSDVEGWSFFRKRSATSTSSHRWHIHQSIKRKYINDADAMRSILEIWDDMPSANEIAAAVASKLKGDRGFLDAVADAVLTRDGKIANSFTDNTKNTHVSLATAQTVLGERTKPTP